MVEWLNGDGGRLTLKQQRCKNQGERVREDMGIKYQDSWLGASRFWALGRQTIVTPSQSPSITAYSVTPTRRKQPAGWGKPCGVNYCTTVLEGLVLVQLLMLAYPLSVWA